MLNLRPARNGRRGLASLDAYRAAEAARGRGDGADCEPTLASHPSFDVEYEALALRVAPPEVTIDNGGAGDATTLICDSANRAGSLICVVEFLTERGLDVRSARITSDGGWFYDVFEVTEAGGGKVTNQRKLEDIKKMLDVQYDDGTADAAADDGGRRAETTVVQLSGVDRPGLLADITRTVGIAGCDVRSAAVWTSADRFAGVFSVTEKGRPLADAARSEALASVLRPLVDVAQPAAADKGEEGDKEAAAADAAAAPPPSSSPSTPGSVSVDRVRGDVHHDRRLHRLMLQDEAASWAAAEGEGKPAGKASAPRAARAAPASPSDSASSPDAGRGRSAAADDDMASACAPAPDVGVAFCARSGYWTISVHSRDRPKLLFDTLCTLADLDYDVFHASVDCKDGFAAQEYYAKPRGGAPEFDSRRAALLARALDASIRRRFPPGVKVHVHSLDRYGCLAALAGVLHAAGLAVTRATVRTYAARYAGAGDGARHTFYVMRADGGAPARGEVEAACASAGGVLAGPGREAAASTAGSGSFAYSFLERRWSPTASPAGSAPAAASFLS